MAARAATALVAVGAVGLALALNAALITTAHGEPSCDLSGINSAAGNREAECRQANEQISGKKHEDVRHWLQVAGAPHATESAIEGSPTPYDADLFAVRFQSPHQGFAGGSACAGPATPAQADGCERVPVLYGTANGRDWAESYRSDTPGYVGGIAWINKRTALAVGGTGAYPRREPNPPGAEWDYDKRVAYDREHGAGTARAWLYEDGSWRELTDELPDGMRGLSALDIWIGREPDGSEWGIAGAYGQLWEWRDGRFTGKRLDKDSPTTGQGGDPQWSVVKGTVSRFAEGSNASASSQQTSDPAAFQYRVRELRIAPDRTQKRAFAFTAGCCGPASAGGSRRIEYVPNPRKGDAGVPADQAPPPAERPRWLVISGQDYGDSVYSFALKPGLFNGTGETDQFGEPQPKFASSLTWSAGQTVVAPGGPESGDSSQPPRYVASDGDTEKTLVGGGINGTVTGNGVPDWKVGVSRSTDPASDRLGLLQTTVTALRREYGGLRRYCPTPPPSVAGHLWINQTDEIYFDASPALSGNPQGTIDTLSICRTEQIQGNQMPALDEEGPSRTRETGIQPGPSWGLNAIDTLDAEGAGFAVGDRGAILRLNTPPPAESDPPPVGERRPAPLGDRSPYEPLRPPPPGAIGAVPPIASQPRKSLPEPRLYRAGSPDASEVARRVPAEDAHTIVMSRDGSEGWAIGPSPEAQGGNTGALGIMTLYRYDGARWTRCDPVGTQFTEPDPACAELAPLYRQRDANNRAIRLTAAARVPLEYDDDPSNDDELEIVAAGTPFETLKDPFGAARPIPTVIRYRDGRWRLEDLAVRGTLNPDVGGTPNIAFLTPLQLAFTSPDDGWMVTAPTTGLTGVDTPPELWRFDGERWIDCMTRQRGPNESSQAQATGPLVNHEACGDTEEDRLAELAKSQRISLATAGERVYLAGVRRPPAGGPGLPSGLGGDLVGNAQRTFGSGAPMILYRDVGAGGQWRADDGGYDPGFDDPDAAGWRASSIAVARREDGSYEGWAVGGPPGRSVGLAGTPPLEAGSALLRLDPSGAEWRPWLASDAASDYVTEALVGADSDGISPTNVNPSRQLTLPGSGAEPGRAFIAAPASPHALAFNPERERWEVAEKPGGSTSARPMAFAPDGRGGAWAAYATGNSSQSLFGASDTYFYDYTDSPPREVFSEVANPIAAGAERPTALTGAPDGAVWLATDSEALYRYDRLTGWERARIPGWDPGRVVTRRTRVNAVAVGPDGAGLAVGDGGKIADVSPSEVRLDSAAGTVCRAGTPAPCGTSFDLRAVALAPDGSALAGGEGLALLWRPAGGELRKIAPPGASASATITGVAMPFPDRAWLTLDDGQVSAGVGDGQGNWSWELENEVEIADQDRLLSEDSDNQPIALRAIAIDSAGHGYAVGDRGLVLERAGDGDEPWRRIDAGVSEDLGAVALPAGEGSGALIGGEGGLILTRSGEGWQSARAGDRLRPDNGYVTGLALIPGTSAGQVEAWAAITPQRSGTDASQLLHYSSDPADPLLDAGETGARATALPDVPAPRPGEVSLAAFGRSDCHQSDDRFTCPPLEGTTAPHEVVLRRVRDEVLARSAEPGGPQFAIYTGDGYDTAGPNAIEAVEQNSRLGARAVNAAGSSVRIRQWTGGFKFRRLNEALLDPIADRGLPLFGAIGSRDLSETRQCAFDEVLTGQFACAENRDKARAGENLAWRQAMEHKPAPWGEGEPAVSEKVAFEPLDDSGLALRSEDLQTEDVEIEGGEVEDPDGESGPLPGASAGASVSGAKAPTGGASTHYAADVLDPAGGEQPIARLVVADSSLGSLAASDPIQRPLEARGGQAAWLERVLCIEGSATDSGQCTREPDQQAIVVSSTPTYSYGPTDPTQTQADAAVFESILLRHRASVVVSGRLGWNGRYWATSPGVHEPCPGDPYVPDASAPAAGQRVCGRDATGETPAGVPQSPGEAASAAGELAQALQGLGAPPAPVDAGASAALVDSAGGAGIVPFVVASGAGGRFDELAERSNAGAADGIWRGYSVVRLDPSGDPRRTVVEQRPIFDWIGMRAQTNVLRPGQRLALRGVGREPIGSGQSGAPRYDEIDSPAITHRYDLVEADPQKPWQPRKDADGNYVPLSPSVGTVDSQTGRVRAGQGKQARTFAIALLSVGDKAATWPLVFEPGKTFRAKPAPVIAPPLPPRAPAPQPPQLRVLGQPPVPPPATPPPPAQLPSMAELAPPVPPALPSLPPVPAAIVAQPPPPQVPPPAPPQGPATLDLSLNAPSVTFAPPTAPIPPPAPPVNPAPPGGARKEAKQRQAATAKSEEGAGEGGAESANIEIADRPVGPSGAAMTRRDRVKPEASFSAIAQREQPSAWARNALYGGGLGLAAATLALGFSLLRPTPRRRRPEVPAPAEARVRRGN